MAEAQSLRIQGLLDAAIRDIYRADMVFGHPGMVEALTEVRQAREAILERGVADGPASGSLRYQRLVRATKQLDSAMAAAEVGDQFRPALRTLLTETQTHADRLWATLTTARPRPSATRRDDERDAGLVAMHFEAWMTTPLAQTVLNMDPNQPNDYRGHAIEVLTAWENIRGRGLEDGAEAATQRYRRLGAALYQLEHDVLRHGAAPGHDTLPLHLTADLATTVAERLDATATVHAQDRRSARRWQRNAEPTRGLRIVDRLRRNHDKGSATRTPGPDRTPTRGWRRAARAVGLGRKSNRTGESAGPSGR